MKGNVDTGIVNIHGRSYRTVALRVSEFRADHPLWSLLTEVLEADDTRVVMRASVSDEQGRVLAVGHAEEYRAASQINRTSALENAETSAIGRALAGLGYGGSEFASADEVANAIAQQQSPQKQRGGVPFGRREPRKQEAEPEDPGPAPDLPEEAGWLDEPLGFGKWSEKPWREMAEGEVGSGRDQYLRWVIESSDQSDDVKEKATYCRRVISNRADKDAGRRP